MGLPLEGIRVLDLSRLLPGGFCSLLLADFGAEVLKVEDTGAGDYIRWAPPYYEGAEDSAKSAMFLSLNRNKRSIRIDLKSEAGREVLLRLVREYDVVLESFRPGVLDRLGVGYERMREVNPGIVYCAISGYGQTGPKRDASGHDMNYLGLIGLLGLTGEADSVGGHGVGGDPIQSAGQIADLGGGALMAAFGILAALRERDGAPARSSSPPTPAGGGILGRPTGSGEGQLVDVSMADGALSWLAMVAGQYFADGVVPHRGEQLLAGSVDLLPPVRVRRRLGHARGALEPKFWQAWCRGVGREDLIEKQFEHPGSEAHGRSPRSSRAVTRAHWTQFATEHDCCLEPVSTGRGARLGAGGGARDGRHARPARRTRRCAPAWDSREARPHPRRAQSPAGPRARRAHRASSACRRLQPGAAGAAAGAGRGGRSPRGDHAGLVPRLSSHTRLRYDG